VSTPIRWDEVDDVEPLALTVRTVPGRFTELGDLLAGIDARMLMASRGRSRPRRALRVGRVLAGTVAGVSRSGPSGGRPAVRRTIRHPVGVAGNRQRDSPRRTLPPPTIGPAGYGPPMMRRMTSRGILEATASVVPITSKPALANIDLVPTKAMVVSIRPVGSTG
jgi:hypothetical protein